MNTLYIFFKAIALAIILNIIESYLNVLLSYMYITLTPSGFYHGIDLANTIIVSNAYGFYKFISLNGFINIFIFSILLSFYNDVFYSHRVIMIFSIINLVSYIIQIVVLKTLGFDALSLNLQYFFGYNQPEIGYLYIFTSAISVYTLYIIWLAYKTVYTKIGRAWDTHQNSAVRTKR